MIRIPGVLAVITLAALAHAAGAREDWRRIGAVSYEAPLQKAVIEIGADEGRFDALKLDVRGFDVEVRSIKVVYGSGAVDDIPLADLFRAGERSRRIELKRGDRFVRQVVVNYRAKGNAQIALLGDMSAARPAWEVLGCKDVNFNLERDVMAVGSREGSFVRLGLSVEGNPVEFREVRVIYGNGKPDVLPVRAVISPREPPRSLDLSGNDRHIDRIEFVYRSIPRFQGHAKVCASGLRAGS